MAEALEVRLLIGARRAGHDKTDEDGEENPSLGEGVRNKRGERVERDRSLGSGSLRLTSTLSIARHLLE